MGGYFPAYGAGGYPAAVAAQLAAAQQSSQVLPKSFLREDDNDVSQVAVYM